MLKVILTLILIFVLVSLFRFVSVLTKAFSILNKGNSEQKNNTQKKSSGKRRNGEKIIELDKDQYHVE